MKDLQLLKDIGGNLFISFFIGMDAVHEPVFLIFCIGIQIDTRDLFFFRFFFDQLLNRSDIVFVDIKADDPAVSVFKDPAGRSSV